MSANIRVMEPHVHEHLFKKVGIKVDGCGGVGAAEGLGAWATTATCTRRR